VRVELHADARAEVRSAALWYDEQRPGLGAELVSAVADAIRRMEQAPLSFPRWPDVRGEGVPIRRALVDRFPHAVAFEVHPDHVLILAVAHAKRRPLYWLARTSRT